MNMVKHWAEQYRSRGYKLLRLKSHSDEPLLANWAEANPEPHEFSEEDNIGVVLGKPSLNLVCVRIGVSDRKNLCESALPKTRVVAGQGARWATYWYTVDAIPDGYRGEKFKDLELLTSGYISVPPSKTLKNFKQIVWSAGFNTPGQSDLPTLKGALERLSACVGRQKKQRQKPSETVNAIANDGNSPLPPWKLRWVLTWMTSLPACVQGMGGRDHCHRVLTALRSAFGLTEDEAVWMAYTYFNPLMTAFENAPNSQCPFTVQQLKGELANYCPELAKKNSYTARRVNHQITGGGAVVITKDAHMVDNATNWIDSDPSKLFSSVYAVGQPMGAVLNSVFFEHNLVNRQLVLVEDSPEEWRVSKMEKLLISYGAYFVWKTKRQYREFWPAKKD